MTPSDLDPVMTVFGPFHRVSEAYYAAADEYWLSLIRDRYGWLWDFGEAVTE